MTGTNRYLVTPAFTEDATWRATLGAQEPLLAAADQGYCLDAPDCIPTGAASAHPCRHFVHRES